MREHGRNLGRLFVMLVLITCADPGRGVEGTAPDFTAAIDFPTLHAYALANNPEIAAARQRWLAARARPSQQGSLPDPTIGFGYMNDGIDGLRRGGVRFGAEQELPFPGKLALREAAATREAQREGAVYDATVLNVGARLRAAYDDYFFAYKSIDIVRGNSELLRRLAEAAEARYRVGVGLQQDVARAQVELSILGGRLTSLEQTRESAAAQVNALLNRPPAAQLGPPVAVTKRPLPYTLDELESLVFARGPLLKAAESEVARTATNLELARRQYYPDFVLRGDYFDKTRINPEWELEVGIRVPLYFWRKQAFEIEEATAGVGEARAARQSTHQEILARLKDFYAQAASAERLVELYGDAVIPQAEVSLRSAQVGYEVGKVDFLTLLNSFTVLNEYQLRYYEELVNFDKALARLEEIAGLSEENAQGDTP